LSNLYEIVVKDHSQEVQETILAACGHRGAAPLKKKLKPSLLMEA
jgi:hypothetical protein